jgi:hypothetical protein
MNKSDQIKTLDEESPGMSNREIAKVVGCTRRLVRMIRNTPEAYETRMPKILIFDIETSPMEIYTWGLFKQHPQIHQIKKDWALLSWSAKWLFGDKIISEKVTPIEAHHRKDESIIAGLWNLLNEADLVIGHNAAKFDTRKSNFRFAMNGLMPPLPYRVIDTMRHSIKVFGSSSYKLDYLNQVFGGNPKITTEFDLWVKCIDGTLLEQKKALSLMEEYNRFDVVVTEELYLKLRPWIKSHPNLALYMDTEEKICTNCGEPELTWLGFYHTPAGRFQSFRCQSCGAIGRSRISDLSKEERARMLLSIAV